MSVFKMQTVLFFFAYKFNRIVSYSYVVLTCNIQSNLFEIIVAVWKLRATKKRAYIGR